MRSEPEYRIMIRVRSPLEILADPQGDWQIIFWVLDVFNYRTPFRIMLAEIAKALGQDARTDLKLPSHEEGEDFIEGTLQFGAVPLRVYYEHSLSYLTLTSSDETALHDAARRIQPHIALVS